MTDKEFRNLEVGKTFIVGNKNIYVKKVGYTECDFCFFKHISCCLSLQEVEVIPFCYAGDREDEENVIFMEVKND